VNNLALARAITFLVYPACAVVVLCLAAFAIVGIWFYIPFIKLEDRE
jgi:hypothetical protein